jgi:hypothetical protein
LIPYVAIWGSTNMLEGFVKNVWDSQCNS